MNEAAYAVFITAIDPKRKIVAIKTVREITGLGLADAKAMVEDLPSRVMNGLYESQAIELSGLLGSAGMTSERRLDPFNPPLFKNLKQMSFDDAGSLEEGEEIKIAVQGGGYIIIGGKPTILSRSKAFLKRLFNVRE